MTHIFKSKSGIAHTLKSSDFGMIFEAIMAHSRDGLFVVDPDGVVLMVNHATEEMFDFKAHEVLGRNVNDLVDEGFYNPSVSVLVIEKKVAISLIQTTRHGKRILSTGIPIFNDAGALQFVLVNDRDISLINTLAETLHSDDLTENNFRMELSDLDLAATVLEGMVIESPTMIKVIKTAVRAAGFDIPLVITGESGVGKSMIVRLIHQLSSRRNGPFADLNCGAITETLIESELFGHESGAFTGASLKGKRGLVEIAHKGTLFLDEIGEIPLALQVKLLKFLEKMEFIRVGGRESVRIDTRIIAATNRNLEKMVEEGTFRSDLYYRLNVVPIVIPPLRERTEEIVSLAQFFMEKFNKEFGADKVLSESAKGVLLRYPFHGNVRELENLIKRLVTMTENDFIRTQDLPDALFKGGGSELSEIKGEGGAVNRHGGSSATPEHENNVSTTTVKDENLAIEKRSDPTHLDSNGVGYRDEIASYEVRKIQDAIKKYGSQRKAAAALGVSQSTLSRKLKKFQSLPNHIIH